MNIIELFEPLHEIIFILLEIGLVLGSLGVVLLSNIVYSAFFLGLVFICISVLYILLNADFLAAAQILIYVGAVNVLIVFAVMLINKSQSSKFFSYWTIGDSITFTSCIGIFFFLTITISNTPWYKINLITESNTINILEQDLTENIQKIGYFLLTQFLLPFELLSILLLVALIGAIVIARQKNIIEIKKSKVLKVKKNLTVF